MIRVTKTRFLANSNLLPFNKMSHGFRKWPSIFRNRHRLLAPIVKNSKIRVMDARKKINTHTGGVGYGRYSGTRNNLNLFEESVTILKLNFFGNIWQCFYLDTVIHPRKILQLKFNQIILIYVWNSLFI